jgi:hypothetical protein
MARPDGCTWTLICSEQSYPCGTAPDGGLIWCTRMTYVDKCECSDSIFDDGYIPVMPTLPPIDRFPVLGF